MLPIHTILHPTDFSEQSENAWRLACALARDYGARLILLHVVHPPAAIYGEAVYVPEPEEYREPLRRQLHQLQVPGADVRAERRLEEGDAATEILRVARETDTNLIVMGTHGRTGLGRLLMGSVAEQVLRSAHCPVLTVKSPPAAASPARVEAAEPVASV
jgi:nucleotide-binding universal stress UspA family protein